MNHKNYTMKMQQCTVPKQNIEDDEVNEIAEIEIPDEAIGVHTDVFHHQVGRIVTATWLEPEEAGEEEESEEDSDEKSEHYDTEETFLMVTDFSTIRIEYDTGDPHLSPDSEEYDPDEKPSLVYEAYSINDDLMWTEEIEFRMGDIIFQKVSEAALQATEKRGYNVHGFVVEPRFYRRFKEVFDLEVWLDSSL